jgi:P-aminobenzoate N-oxygenase AurF
MLTHEYSYASVLEGSVKNAWTVEDAYQGRTFDFTKPFLPDRIAGVNDITCLTDDERRKLNQIRGNAYCHIFAFVEEYIVPLVLDNATRDIYGDEQRLRSLVRFAEEELKHQELMGRACAQFEAGFGTTPGLIPGREAVADVVLSSSPLAALLLTAMIEWFVQLHYLAHVRDAQELDPLFRDILRFHWIDEARHARLDTLLVDEVAGELPLEERERAIDELLQLGGAVDGLLAQQLELDLDTLERSVGRTFTEAEKTEIRAAQQRSYRWTFIVSGLEHPKFVEIVERITVDGPEKITDAARALSS